jgi:hypothetical protein
VQRPVSRILQIAVSGEQQPRETPRLNPRPPNTTIPPQVPIPDHLDIFHLHQEAEPSDMSALQAVIDHIKKELASLHKQVGGLGGLGRGPFGEGGGVGGRVCRRWPASS